MGEETVMDPTTIKEGLDETFDKIQEGKLDYGKVAADCDAFLSSVYLRGAAWAFEAHADEWDEAFQKLGSNVDPGKMLDYVRALPAKLRGKAAEFKAAAAKKEREVSA